ncbi:hypothetical protein GW17_00014479 [Ensete ventricosum]|nr:hypothetical protein GW17_00014479 [Ensete ventricosum]
MAQGCGARWWFGWRTIRSIPPQMPMWIWCRRGSLSNSDADVTAELAWALIEWADSLSALSFFPATLKQGFLELAVGCGEGPLSTLGVRIFPKRNHVTALGIRNTISFISFIVIVVRDHFYFLRSSSALGPRALALEAKKSCYDFDSIVSIESLASIRERYSILNEYPPTLAPPTGSRSPSKVQEILVEEVTRRAPEEEARRAPEVPSKRQVEDSVGQKKKRKVFNRHRPHHDPIVETSTPRPKLRSVRELCGARPEMDDRDYRAIWMCNLSEHAPDAPRDRLDAADAQDADLAERRGFGEIYQRHVDPSAGVRRIHLIVRGADGRGGKGHRIDKFLLGLSLSFLCFASIFDVIARPFRPMMVLYVEKSPTTINDTINIFDLDSSLMVTGRVIIPIGEMESPMNLINVDVTRRRYTSFPNPKVISRSRSLLDLFSTADRA